MHFVCLMSSEPCLCCLQMTIIKRIKLKFIHTGHLNPWGHLQHGKPCSQDCPGGHNKHHYFLSYIFTTIIITSIILIIRIIIINTSIIMIVVTRGEQRLTWRARSSTSSWSRWRKSSPPGSLWSSSRFPSLSLLLSSSLHPIFIIEVVYSCWWYSNWRSHGGILKLIERPCPGEPQDLDVHEVLVLVDGVQERHDVLFPQLGTTAYARWVGHAQRRRELGE